MRQNIFTYPQTANFYKRSVTDGYFKGYFADQAALEAAYPVGLAGWFAIVGSTDTIWVWDTGTVDWVDTGNSTPGDVVGPASSTDNALVRFDGTSGKLVQNSGIIISDSNNMSGIAQLEALEAIIGDPGTEGSGISIAGTTYESSFKVSDIDGTNYAQTILHRHSTILEPLIVGARSNSDDSSHADVTAGQNVFSFYGVGYAGSDYKLFGSMNIGVDLTGTISNTSAPGRMTRSITPNGSIVPVIFETVDNNGVVRLTKRSTAGVNVETLSADKSIAATDKESQSLDPNGANRNVTLYASPIAGDYFLFKNKGTGGFNLVLKNNAGTILTTIGNGVVVAVLYDGTNWNLV